MPVNCKFKSHHSFKAALTIAATLTATLTLAGCASQEGEQNSPAVETSNVTHSPSVDSSQIHSERAFPTGNRNSSVLLLEATGPQSIRMQRPATYQMKVTNLTDTPVKNVMLSTMNGEGFQTTGVEGSTTRPTDTGGMSYTIGSLGPKESKTFQLTGIATQVRTIDTCYMLTCDPPSTTLCTSIQVTNPLLLLTVRAPADADICQGIEYHYVVSNTGTGVARSVMVHEDLPSGITTSDGQTAVNATIGDIPQGESREAVAHLKAARTGTFNGQAMASSNGDNSKTQSTVTAVHAPVLDVALQGASEDYAGKQVAYKATVTNKGDAPARNAKLQITRSGIGSVAATGADQAGIISLGSLDAGGSRSVDVLATSDQGGTTGIAASASSDCASPVSQSANIKFMTIPALLLETVDEVDPVRVGENVIYDVKVTNQGTGPDTNVAVNATIPDGEQFVSATGSSDSSVNGQSITFAPIAHLDAKQSVMWKVTVKAAKAGDVSFKTSVTSDGIKTPAEKTEPTKLY